MSCFFTFAPWLLKEKKNSFLGISLIIGTRRKNCLIFYWRFWKLQFVAYFINIKSKAFYQFWQADNDASIVFLYVTDGRTNRRTNGWTNRLTHRRMDKRTNTQSSYTMLYLMYVWWALTIIWSDFPFFDYFSTMGTDSWTDPRTDGRTEGQSLF